MGSNNYNKLKEEYAGKKILVVGLGLQGGGAGVAKFFAELGAYVTVTDKKNDSQLAQSIAELKDLPVDFHLAGHRMADFLEADVIFKGPSVPWTMPEIQAAREKGVPIEMELSFVASNTPAKIIGITGTRGKTTTTQMIYEILKSNNFPVYLGGSLPGISTINYLKTLGDQDWLLMELPSWPLSGFHDKKISPHIAVFTNLYPDHLNYYKNIDDYLYDKKAVYLYQKKGDFLIAHQSLKDIIEADNPVGKISYYQASDFPEKLSHLRGSHNLENAAAAMALAKILDLSLEKAVVLIKEFAGVPYRQQTIGQKDSITFINDTTSTTPIATIKALESFSGKNIILILGGNSKNLPYDDLLKRLTDAKKIVLLKGSFTDEILPDLKNNYTDKITDQYSDLEEAIRKAYQLAKNYENSCVLFSPGATSFAMFNNEFHRGQEFNRVAGLIIKE